MICSGKLSSKCVFFCACIYYICQKYGIKLSVINELYMMGGGKTIQTTRNKTKKSMPSRVSPINAVVLLLLFHHTIQYNTQNIQGNHHQSIKISNGKKIYFRPKCIFPFSFFSMLIVHFKSNQPYVCVCV